MATQRIGRDVRWNLGVENRMDEELRTYLEGMEKRLFEKMRDMQREIIDNFEAFSGRESLRLRKVEEAQSNLEYLEQKRRCP
jgi:hypothetical protein